MLPKAYLRLFQLVLAYNCCYDAWELVCAVTKQIKFYVCNDKPKMHINHSCLLFCPTQVAGKGSYLLTLLSYTVVTVVCSHICIYSKVSLITCVPSSEGTFLEG